MDRRHDDRGRVGGIHDRQVRALIFDQPIAGCSRDVPLNLRALYFVAAAVPPRAVALTRCHVMLLRRQGRVRSPSPIRALQSIHPRAMARASSSREGQRAAAAFLIDAGWPFHHSSTPRVVSASGR